MFSNSQKKLLQKYDLYDQINKILDKKHLDLSDDLDSLKKTEIENIFAKEKLQKIFESKILNKSQPNLVKNKSNKLQKSKLNFESQKITKSENIENTDLNENLFDDRHWKDFILPRIEHPQFTKPQIWKGCAVPSVLLAGNHLEIQKWRQFDWKKD